MKSNDDIPEDEMLLAEAIAAAKADGFRWTARRYFGDGCCCATGALHLAKGRTATYVNSFEIRITENEVADRLGAPHGGLLIATGNDYESEWSSLEYDHGESLGWAFRCAMTQEDS